MDIQKYLKSLNPDMNQHEDLIYGREYKLWRKGKYIGVAVWTKDDNVGDSFQRDSINDIGEKIAIVYIADKWVLLN